MAAKLRKGDKVYILTGKDKGKEGEITQIIGNGLVTLIDEKTQYSDFFNNKEMVFYKNINDLSEKIMKISRDEKLRKQIAKNGKDKYMKYFNSNLVAEFIINKTFDINRKNFKKFIWSR